MGTDLPPAGPDSAAAGHDAPLLGTGSDETDAGYLRLLLLMLLSAAFFNGFDEQVLSLLLPQIKQTFHVGVALLGILHIPLGVGQFLAFFLVRKADTVGRRPVLLWSVVGFTLFTALTAFSWDIWAFTAFQTGAQFFIGAEYALAVTVVVEEFPTRRRGRALGALQTLGPLGAIAVAIMLLAHLEQTHLGWRAFYLVGLAPVVVVAGIRLRMRETRRFTAERLRPSGPVNRQSWLANLLQAWRGPYRSRLRIVVLVSLLQTIPSSAAIGWWAYYAERQRGYTPTLVAIFVALAYGLGVSGYYSCGRLMERFGRRPTAVLYSVGGVGFGAMVFQVGNKPLSFFLLMGAVFFGLGIAPVLSAFATELFPTAIRSQASAWVRIAAGAGALVGPAVAGVLGSSTGLIGNVGDAISVITLVELPNIWLVLRYLPEARGKALEEMTLPAPPIPGRPAAPLGPAG